MAGHLYPPTHPQSIGEVLDAAFRIFKSTWIGCVPYALLALLAGQLRTIELLATHQPLAARLTESSALGVALWVVGVLLQIILMSALILRQAAMAWGPDAGFGAGFGSALRRAPSLLGFGVLFVILGMGWAAPVIYWVSQPGKTARGALVLLLLVPVVYLSIALSSGNAAVLLRACGPLAAVKRSFLLVWGHWWRVTSLYSTGIVVLMVFYLIAGIIGGFIAALSFRGDVAGTAAVISVIVGVFAAAVIPYYTALNLAVFADLEVRRLGADLQRRIADVTG